MICVDGSTCRGTTAPTTPKPVDVAKTEKEISQKVMAKINQHRSSVGASQLGSHAILNSAVVTRANDMYTRYDHVRPDGTSFGVFINQQAGYGQYGTAIGENIWGFVYRTDRETPESMANAIVNDWKKSSGHRATMESRNANEGAVGIKMVKAGNSYDIAAVFITGRNISR